MKKITSVFFILSLLFSSQSLAQTLSLSDLNHSTVKIDESKLIFTASLEKPEFIESEKVLCILQLTNNSNDTVDVLSLFPGFGGVRLQLVDVRSGERMKYTGIHVTRSLSKETIKIKPHGKALKIIELNTMWGLPIGAGAADQFIPAGTYKLSASYDEGESPKVQSMEFLISMPRGRDAIDYNIFLSIVRKRWSRASRAEVVDRILQFETESPRSGYVPIVLSLAASIYKFALNDAAKGDETYVRLVENYPVGVKMPGVLDAAMDSFGVPQKQRAFLQKLIKSSTDSVGRAYIQQFLESLTSRSPK